MLEMICCFKSQVISAKADLSNNSSMTHTNNSNNTDSTDIQKCINKVKFRKGVEETEVQLKEFGGNAENTIQDPQVLLKATDQQDPKPEQRQPAIKAESSPTIELMTLSPNGISNKGINNNKQNSISFSSFKTFAKKYGSKDGLTAVTTDELMNSPSQDIKLVKKVSKLINLSHSLPILEEFNSNHEERNENFKEYSLLKESSLDLFTSASKMMEGNFQNYSISLSDQEGELLSGNKVELTPFGLKNHEKIGSYTILFGLPETNLSQYHINIDSSQSINISSQYSKTKSIHKEVNEDDLDVLLNPSALNEYKTKPKNPIFCIYFDFEQKSFYIRASKTKQINTLNLSILLIKLTKPLILNRKELVALGDIVVEIESKGKSLKIKKVSAKQEDMLEYEFNSDQEQQITIGRSKDCTICFKSNSLSKYNLTISYRKNTIKDMKACNASNCARLVRQFNESDLGENTVIRYWEITDGSYQKPSTNGVWIFATHSYELYEGVIIKVGKNKLTVN